MTVLSTYNFLNAKFDVVDFEGVWLDSFGRPELNGLWFVYGKSGQGKTSFMVQLCDYLGKFGKSFYGSFEQGASASLQIAARRAGIKDTDKHIVWPPRHKKKRTPLTKEALRDILTKHKSPQFVVIDSIQRSRFKYMEFVDFMNEFPDKLFIVVSQADKTGYPRGSVAEALWYDADVKVNIAGFTAYFNSRFENPETGEGGKPYVIWDEGAEKFEAKALDR